MRDSKELQELIRLCKKNDRKAQERLFKLSYPLALQVSRRYTPNLDDAQGFAIVVVVPLTATFVYFLAMFSYGLAGDLAARVGAAVHGHGRAGLPGGRADGQQENR